MKLLAKSRYGSLLIRIILLFALYSLCRILFYFFNTVHFEQAGIGEVFRLHLAGLRFDASALAVINLPFLFISLLPFAIHHQRWMKIMSGFFYVVPNMAGLAANCGDMVYFRFTAKRSTADVFDAMTTGGDFAHLLPQFIRDFWYIFMIWLLLSALLFFVFLKTNPQQVNAGRFWLRLFSGIPILAAGMGIVVLAARGGTQLRPLGIITAGEYTTATFTPLVLNTPFCIIQTIGKTGIEEIKYMSTTAAEKIFNPLHQKKSTKLPDKKFNIVILIMEGFGKEHSGLLNKKEDQPYEGFTPFLDSLSEHHALYFTAAYANCKKSIEAIPAITAGLPALMDAPYITSVYSGNKLRALPEILASNGWATAFFHGGTNGTMRFDAWAQMSGFRHYHGRTEYNNESDYDGKWGIYDEAFLQYCAGEMNRMKPPFMATVFTLSSHHPYKIPPQHAGKFRKGSLPVHESIGYADFSLRRFFETASKMPWYDSTLFIITSDHTPDASRPEYLTRAGIYAIPMVFYVPGGKIKGRSEDIVQQTDIMPSVLDFLGFGDPYIAFGNSIFDSSMVRFSVNYMSGTYQLITRDYVLQFDGKSTTGLYNRISDPLMERNLIQDVLPETQENLIKSLIQQYNHRLRNNKLYPG
jgi:phosphoglycerol transferase MdoB-like AlkP superfamily enzyme